METVPGWAFPAIAFAIWASVPAYAWAVRGRTFAIFAAVVMAISLIGAVVTHARVSAWILPGYRGWLDAGFLCFMLAAAVHYAHLVRARMRGRPFRLAISIPGQYFAATGALASVWLLALLPLRTLLWALDLGSWLHALRWLDLAPYAVGAASVVTSVRPWMEVVRVRLGRDGPDEVTRVPVERHRHRAPAPLERRPLRIVQLSDPHLGPWQSVRRLRRNISRLLDHDPDLVLLTGDFLTMESNDTPGALAAALAPLQGLPGRCFAIFGNHDHEAPDEVRDAMKRNAVTLLVDEEAVAETPVGPVQIVGADYCRRDRAAHLEALFARFPRREGHLRLLLLHDPLGFRDVPKGEADLTLSGHTHGGQVGLVSFGLDWTVLSGSRWPDHGLFAHGPNRLYVHRGTGFYGFPLRIGVPGELSLMELQSAWEAEELTART
ncbi:MAG: metallophosphoesterase [Myxococcota bacterium]|nr:metallophosphoesterase [Myxococcota bacterium]